MDQRALSNASGRTNAQQSRQAMSRISSFKRDWNDEDPGQSQDTVFSWPESPERTTASFNPVKDNANTSKQMSASERRLAAIQAALAENSDSQASDPSATLFTDSSSVASSSTAAKRPAPQSAAEPPSKKRQLPWEANHSALRAASNQKFKTTVLSAPVTTADNSQSNSAPTGHISVASKILLSSEQQHVLNMIMEGKNVFFTGSAGTGKSVLLREVIRNLRLKHSRSVDAVAITASTGIAACNIGGVTLHSFSGAGFAREPAEQLASRIRRNKKSSTRWVRTIALIIDEVSMVDGELFDKLEKIARLMRRSTRPFGGIQLILTGDFFQLPPVSKGSAKFAFEAESWSSCIDVTFNLTQVFRQKDQDFVDMLNEMRFGQLSQKSIQKFKDLSRPINYGAGIEPTELFPRREDVDRANQYRNCQLSGELHSYDAIDGGIITDEVQRKNLLSNFMASEKLDLRIDSQVMLIKNTDDTLVNGSTGKVIGFYDPATFRQHPLTGEVEIVEEQFDLTTTAGKKAHLRRQRQLAEGTVTRFPLVRFFLQGTSGRTRDVLVAPDVFKVELPNGEVQASRTQFPLVLAWAMSIHKSQGQTLDRVKVDLKKVFEKGQAYVALSRATSLEGLQVLGFDPAKVLAHPKVVAWNKNLTTFT